MSDLYKKPTKKTSLHTKNISEQLIRTGIEKILSNKKQEIDTIIGKDVYYLLDRLFPENTDQAFCNIADKTTDEFDNILEFHLWRGYTYGIKHEEIQLEVHDNGEMMYQFIINKDGSCYMGIEDKVLLKELKDLNLNIDKIFVNKD